MVVVSISLFVITLLSAIGYVSYIKQAHSDAVTENTFLISELKATNQEVAALKEKVFTHEDTEKRLIKEFENTSSRHQLISQKNTEHKNTIESLTQNYNQLLEDKKSLLSEIENLKSEKSALIEQVRTIESNSFVTDTLKEKALLEIQITRLKEALKKAKLTHIARLSKTQQKHNQKALGFKKKITNLEFSIADASMKDTKIALLKKDIEERDKSLRTIERKAQDAEILASNIAKKMEIKIEIIQKYEKKIGAIQEEYNIMVNTLSKARKLQKNLEKDIHLRDQKLKDTQLTIRQLKTQLYKSQSKLKLRLQELSRAKDAIEKIMLRTQNTLINEDDQASISENSFDRQALASPKTNPQQQKTQHKRHFSDILHKKEPLVQGKIVEIDRSHDFIIIDLGTKDGLKENMAIRILQNNAEVARAHILEARSGMSAANVHVLGDYVIQTGDRVEILSPA